MDAGLGVALSLGSSRSTFWRQIVEVGPQRYDLEWIERLFEKLVDHSVIELTCRRLRPFDLLPQLDAKHYCFLGLQRSCWFGHDASRAAASQRSP
jgi:hypothetical protein